MLLKNYLFASFSTSYPYLHRLLCLSGTSSFRVEKIKKNPEWLRVLFYLPNQVELYRFHRFHSCSLSILLILLHFERLFWGRRLRKERFEGSRILFESMSHRILSNIIKIETQIFASQQSQLQLAHPLIFSRPQIRNSQLLTKLTQPTHQTLHFSGGGGAAILHGNYLSVKVLALASPVSHYHLTIPHLITPPTLFLTD